MPLDADLGRALADRLSAAYTGRIHDIYFTYDSWADSETIGDQPVVMLQPFNMERFRESRDEWRKDVSLLATMLVKQKPNSDQHWFDVYLDSWDSILDLLEADTGVDRLEITGRYELDQSQTQARLICQTIIRLNYK